MSGTSKGGKRFAEKKRKDNPDYFSELSGSARKPRGGRNSPGSFKPGHEFAAKGGRAGKRGKSKVRVPFDASTIDTFDLEYEEEDIRR